MGQTETDTQHADRKEAARKRTKNAYTAPRRDGMGIKDGDPLGGRASSARVSFAKSSTNFFTSGSRAAFHVRAHAGVLEG